ADPADDDDGAARKRSDDDRDRDDDTDRKHRRRKHHRGERDPITQAAIWLDAGAAVTRRTLTHTATGTMRPPDVGTASVSGRIAGELYPDAAAGLGLAGDYDRTIALGIAVPGTTTVAPITCGHYAIGIRYR